MAATLVSFALCLLYLSFLPFHPWALAGLIGVSAQGAVVTCDPDAHTIRDWIKGVAAELPRFEDLAHVHNVMP